jgi:N-acetylglucosamine kinase-like BadF-type ATPase
MVVSVFCAKLAQNFNMIIIADSGSTKTDWRLWNPDTNEAFSFSSKGLNPYFVNSMEVSAVLKDTISLDILEKTTHVFFYGSGCSSKDSKKIIHDGIMDVCIHASLEIQHDLMGAARALLGHDAGLACILGTGSNACYYNGDNIEEEGVSYGFILGDEGSGNHMGRLLLKSVFSKKAPQEIQDAFKKSFPELDLTALLRHLYQLPSPNKYLAGFSPFISAHRKNVFIQKLIADSINRFIDEFIVGLKRSDRDKIGFQGSIAYYYKDEIAQVFNSRGLKCDVFLEKTIEKLFHFHKTSFEKS